METVSANGQHTLWVGTEGEGLSRLENGQWTTIDTKSGLPNGHIYSILETSSPNGTRTLWVGTYGGGLARLENGNWRTFDTSSGLINNVIASLLETTTPDGQRMLWIGTNGGGLARLTQNQWLTFDTKLGLPDNTVLHLLETTSEKNSKAIWIGTYGGGLARLEDNRWTIYNVKNGFPDNSVLCLLQSTDSAHTLWIGTEGNGLVSYAQGKWKRYDKTNGLPTNAVRSLLETVGANGEHILWVGTSMGLAKFQNEQWTIYDSKSGLPDNTIFGLLATVSPNGSVRVWVGTLGAGLACLENGKWTVFNAKSGLANNTIYSLKEVVAANGDHLLWVGTTAGISILNLSAEDRGWTTINDTTNPALPNNIINQICIDTKNRIYLFTNKGVARLTSRIPTQDDPSPYSIYTFTTDDGLPSNECNAGAAMVDSRGRIWAGTVGGAAMLDPSQEFVDHSSKPLYIERTLLSGKERVLNNASLAYDENNLAFEFALVSYFRESDTRYKTQLVGIDKEASDWVKDYKKEYPALPEGNYQFKVWGKDYAGNISGPISVNFKIRAAPWRSWWAYLFYSIGASMGIFGLVKYQVNKTKKRAKEYIRKQREMAQLKEAELRAEAAELQAKAAEMQTKAIEAEHHRKSEELAYARQLQLSMLPKENISLDRVEIIGQMRTATEVGGDYYDFIKIDEHRYCLAIGDATGHGMGAGLVVGMIKSMLVVAMRSLTVAPATALSMATAMIEQRMVIELMQSFNASLKASLAHRGIGMCLAIAIIDTAALTIDICCAGMPSPLLFHSCSDEMEAINLPGAPLGFMKEIKLKSRRIRLESGDKLILLSDGFHERMNGNDEIWKYGATQEELLKICRDESKPGEIANRLIEASDRFAGGRANDDDMTVIVVSVK